MFYNLFFHEINKHHKIIHFLGIHFVYKLFFKNKKYFPTKYSKHFLCNKHIFPRGFGRALLVSKVMCKLDAMSEASLNSKSQVYDEKWLKLQLIIILIL